MDALQTTTTTIEFYCPSFFVACSIAGAGNLIAGVGNLIAGAGNLIAGAGNLIAGVGNLIAGVGNLIAGAGNLIAGAGNLIAGAGNLIAGVGNLIAGAGNLIAGVGNLIAGAGNLIAGAGNLIAGAGRITNLKIKSVLQKIFVDLRKEFLSFPPKIKVLFKKKGHHFKSLPDFQLFVLKLLRSLKKYCRLASVNFTTFEHEPH